MELPMRTWNRCMEVAGANEAEFGSLQLQQQLHNVLLSHVSVCQSMGGFFLPHMVKIFTTMLGVYAKFSALVNSSIQAAGPLGAQHSAIKSMRSVKKVTLQLVETFVDTSETQEHLQVIAQQFVPALMEPILNDYAQSVADAKCAPRHVHAQRALTADAAYACICAHAHTAASAHKPFHQVLCETYNVRAAVQGGGGAQHVCDDHQQAARRDGRTRARHFRSHL